MNAKLRTIHKAYEEIKSNDPNTCVTEWCIRQLVKGGAIPCVMVGNRALIEMSALENYFKGVNV